MSYIANSVNLIPQRKFLSVKYDELLEQQKPKKQKQPQQTKKQITKGLQRCGLKITTKTKPSQPNTDDGNK